MCLMTMTLCTSSGKDRKTGTDSWCRAGRIRHPTSHVFWSRLPERWNHAAWAQKRVGGPSEGCGGPHAGTPVPTRTRRASSGSESAGLSHRPRGPRCNSERCSSPVENAFYRSERVHFYRLKFCRTIYLCF